MSHQTSCVDLLRLKIKKKEKDLVCDRQALFRFSTFLMTFTHVWRCGKWTRLHGQSRCIRNYQDLLLMSFGTNNPFSQVTFLSQIPSTFMSLSVLRQNFRTFFIVISLSHGELPCLRPRKLVQRFRRSVQRLQGF